MKIDTLRRVRSSVLAWARDQGTASMGALPVLLNLPITDNCNARCVMCDVWKTRSTGEMGAGELGRVLSDRLFERVEHVGISGGEPSLRADLPDLVQVAVACLPRLGSLSITTHGFHHDRWRRFLPLIKQSCADRDVQLVLNLSVDGVGTMHDAVRGIPGAFGRTMRTHQVARDMDIRVVWQATVSSANVYSVGDLLRRSSNDHVSVQFRQATVIPRLDNTISIQDVALKDDEKSFFADFLQSKSVAAATRSPARRLFYKDLARRLVDNSSRQAPCHFQRQGILVSPHGELFQCSIATESLGNALEHSAHDLYFSRRSVQLRRTLLADTCPSCVHDQSGAWAPAALLSEAVSQTRVGRNAALVLRAARGCGRGARALARARIATAFRQSPNVPDRRNRTAVVIGAYGGEHVGDAAILGGVLLRLHRDGGVDHARVASTRIDRTRRWVRSLALPIDVDVFRYERPDLQTQLATADLLVYGGGPIMDLPELLVRHLESASAAVSKGLPFVFEGVGYGPFRSAASRIAAHALMDMSSSVSVRGEQAAVAFRSRGQEPRLDRDPAFDYLETRSKLDRITLHERRSIDALFSGSVGRTKIAINLRPLWSKYGGQDLAERERTFIAELAEALVNAATRAPVPLTYVFCPMNADQYGFSDLASAYRLRDALRGRVDFRIWEAEPGVDAVLDVLRRVHGAVAMRFHAAIFSMSQGVPTIGIDYQFGGSGKVAELFRSGHGYPVMCLDDFKPEVLIDSLVEICGMPRAVPGANSRRP